MAEALRYLENHGASPEEYVAEAFNDHDVVFLGEYHRIRRQVELVARLIPRLHAAGITVLATEFARRIDQELLDRLVTDTEWNEELAREITFRNFVFWGYQEYVDVYKAAWQVNQSLSTDEEPFRVVALNNAPDWSVLESPQDRDDPELRRAVWRSETEADWATVILDLVEEGEKVLVYSGIHHAFTRYRQPIYDVATEQFRGFARDRMGNHVFRAIGDRAMTIYMHAPWVSADGYGAPDVHPVDGAIDLIMAAASNAAAPRGTRPVAFDTAGTPFGRLKAETSFYEYGYRDFTLADFCDGYIFLEPFAEVEGVTPIADFINEANIAFARAQSPNPAFRDASIQRFNQAIAWDADMARRVRHLVLR